MNIAVRMMGSEKWIAGEVLLRNLSLALKDLRRMKVSLYILSSNGNEISQDQAGPLGEMAVLRYQNPRRWSPSWLFNSISDRLLSTNRTLERILRSNDVQALFGSSLCFKCPGVAVLSWLPDFQHVHLPEMFDEEECSHRDKLFTRSAKLATRIILLSESVKRDFETFSPVYAPKVRVLSPISYITDSIYDMNLRSILELYHLPEKFVYLPNQFWKHKNHEVVFRAVKNLRDKGIKVVVVCTGYPADYRHAGYFVDLWTKVSQWNLREQIIYLGMVPHEHVLLLIRQSICVINPSRFEGWGMSVDEARSVGKQVLVSNIPVHREQDPPKATYFSPQDCEDLEAKLAQIWNGTAPGPDAELERAARLKLPERLRSYAETFVSICRAAYEEVR